MQMIWEQVMDQSFSVDLCSIFCWYLPHFDPRLFPRDEAQSDIHSTVQAFDHIVLLASNPTRFFKILGETIQAAPVLLGFTPILHAFCAEPEITPTLVAL